jgi:hypothetical protein
MATPLVVAATVAAGVAVDSGSTDNAARGWQGRGTLANLLLLLWARPI